VLVASACSSGALSSHDSQSGQGVSAKAIEIGTVLPLTGGAATAAQGVQAGMRAAIGEVNAAGGVNGRTLKLTVLDDNFDAATHVADFKRLTSQDKVFAVLTPAGTANLPGDWPIAKSTGIPVFAPYLPDDPGLPSVFSLGTSHKNQAEILAKYLSEHGVKTVAFIGQQNSLGTSMLAGLKEESAKLGMKVTSTQYVQPTSADLSAAVLNVKATDPQAVLLGTDNTQSTLILKQAQQLQWHPTFAGDSSTAGTNGGATTTPAGASANGLIGSYFAESPSDTTNAGVAAWQEAETKYAPGAVTEANSSFALQAYAFAKVFIDILQQMGQTLTWSNFEKVTEGLKSYDVEGLIPPVTFGPLPGGHVGTAAAKVAKFENGKWTSMTTDFVNP
jgi:branched-chain amino acid transport system substrate-binding protein